MLPEAALVVGALAVLGFDLVTGKGRSTDRRLGAATLLGALAVVAAIYGAFRAGTGGPAFGAVLVLDSLTLATRVGALALTFLTLLLLPGTTRLRHPAELVAL